MLMTTTQLQNYIDVRLLQQYTSDSVGGVPTPVNMLATNTFLLAILESASQDVISACLRANTYTVNEIVSLAGDQIGGTLPQAANGTITVSQDPVNLVPITTSMAIEVPGIGEGLRTCVAGLVWGKLLDRRKLAVEDFDKLAGSYIEADKMLQRITLGERIWQVPGAPQAGLPGVTVLGQNAGPFQISRQVGLFGRLARPWWGGPGPFGPFNS